MHLGEFMAINPDLFIRILLPGLPEARPRQGSQLLSEARPDSRKLLAKIKPGIY